MQLLLKVQQLVLLALHHPCHGNARPAAHHLGDVVGGHLFTDHGLGSLLRVQLLLYGGNVVVQGLHLAISDFGHLSVVALTLGTVSLEFEVLQLLFVLLNPVHEGALAVPLGTELVLLVTQFGNVLVQLVKF